MYCTFNLDPEYGIERFVSHVSSCINIKAEDELLYNGFVTFNREHARFYIDGCDEPDSSFFISDGESSYGSINKKDFYLLVEHLGVKVNNRKDGYIITERFTANAFLNALNHIEKIVKMDNLIKDLS